MKNKPKSARAKHSSSRRSNSASTNNLRVVFSKKQIEKRVRELADKINRDYKGKHLHVVGILENCFMFMADLLRALKVPVTCHFLKIEMRDRTQGGSALRELIYTPKIQVPGNDVLLMDGIMQTGMTQDHIYRYLLGQKPASLRTATLVDKSQERTIDFPIDYKGFKTSEKFLVGYGLGYQERYRNLPYIATLN